MLCVLPGKLSLDHRTLAVAGCTGSLGAGHVDGDLCLHTGFLVATVEALEFHAVSGVRADSQASHPSLELI